MKSIFLIKILILSCTFVMITSARYIHDLFTLPFASNNIYEQQYQMHRFVVDYYKKPVAVNDLGYVSYKNNNYVLDLWGLASRDAFNLRRTSQSPEWMNELSMSHQVELAMIYQDWFDAIPDDWITIGELRLGRRQVVVAGDKVVFYAVNWKGYDEIVPKLQSFISTLPGNVEFIFAMHNGQVDKVEKRQYPTGQ